MSELLLKPIRHCETGRGLAHRIWCLLAAPVVYELAQDCEVAIPGIVDFDERDEIILLPKGFRCDLASTPRVAWLCGLRQDAPGLLLPGIVHDWYYRHGHFLAPSGRVRCGGRGRLYADKLLAALVHQQTGLRLTALVVYVAVRLFGWTAWRHNARYRRLGGLTALWGDYID